MLRRIGEAAALAMLALAGAASSARAQDSTLMRGFTLEQDGLVSIDDATP